MLPDANELGAGALTVDREPQASIDDRVSTPKSEKSLLENNVDIEKRITMD